MMSDPSKSENKCPLEVKFLSMTTRINNARNKVSSPKMLLPVLLGIMMISCGLNSLLIQHANAQFPSLFPPPGITGDTAAKTAQVAKSHNDREPPEIELVTTELTQGKNVLIVKITDESYLESRQVKYIDNGRIALADLARDHDNVYYALVNVMAPASVIEIDVIDGAGNRATVVSEIPVNPPPDLNDYLNRILTFIDNIIASLENIRI